MYKKYLLLLFIVMIIYLSAGCYKSEVASKKNTPLIGPFVSSINSINVTVDPRIELLSIVQYLSNYSDRHPGLVSSVDFEYKEKVTEHFGKFSKHKAVKQFEKMQPNFSFDAPPGLALFMDNAFLIRDDAILTDYIIARAGGENTIQKFFDSLNEFSQDTNFVDFFISNEDYYRKLIDNTINLIPKEKDLIGDLEDYYGISQKSYNIVLVSLYGKGAFGPSIETKENDLEIYSILGSNQVGFDSIPLFSSQKDIIYIVQHEFSHSFINPITKKYMNIANSYSELFEPIKKEMSNMAYGSWEICLNEHIIRALTSRFVYKEDPLVSEDILNNEKHIGFIYVQKLFSKLEEYENNRDKYPTFDDFYPELIKSLE